MLLRRGLLFCLLCDLVVATARAEPPTAVVRAEDASFVERLAAKEVRRYVYLRSGKLLPIVADLKSGGDGGAIVVGAKDRPLVRDLLSDAKLKKRVEALAAEQYILKTLPWDGRTVLLVAGGDGIGTLYGAYRLTEHLGMRFYLHGDVVPDGRIPLEMPTLDETRRPLFALRGILPFHDFPEGPDWWNREGYKAVLGQLPKMGMNFFGLHCYPEGGAGPEPLVWIGPPEEIAPDGKVNASYPSRHFAASNLTGSWAYRPGKTGDYVFGAAEMFDRDDYGADYMRGTYPWTKMSPEQCNALFDRMGNFLGDVFTYAGRLGVKTCIGTETPLTIPTPVKERLEAAGKDPADPAVVQEVYEGMFRRIAEIHPLDYYWLWTSEGWTWRETKQEQIDAVAADLRTAIAAAEKVRPPFTLATCGWVLGPPQNRTLFDEFLPKNMPISCINRTVGNTPVNPAFALIKGRPKWAIPWLEDDGAMTIPQLWAGRMRRDAADARKYDCTGLLGIHWRTRIVGPTVSALAKAGWDQAGWKGEVKIAADGKSQYLPIADFYTDWAASQFGPQAAGPIAALFARLDGRLPRPAQWIRGAGNIQPDKRPWEVARKEYDPFVDELAALRPRIEGPGNLERFDYWLNNFRYIRAVGKVRCAWARFNAALNEAKAEKNPEVRRKLARESALPARKELVAAFAELFRHLLATVTTAGEMGNVCNWQQQMVAIVLTKPGRELAGVLGEELPADAMPSKQYTGPPRLFVPEVRTNLVAGEPLKLKVIVLGGKPQAAELCWRPLGPGKFARAPLTHVARGVYAVTLPPKAVQDDLEYYVRATVGGRPLLFPPTAPTLNQTVVVGK